MQSLCTLLGLLLAVAIVNCGPVVKREAEEDLSPLNEVYVFEADEAADGDRGDRDKRKIGLTLGVKNGIINFVFDKIDSFLDAKTKALIVLDDTNRAENAIFGIDSHQSATTNFLNNLVSQKIKAATSSFGPVVNSATTLLSGVSAGLSKAVVGKIAPLSSLSGGLSGGGAHADGGAAGASGAASGTAAIGDFLASKISSLSSLSQSSGGSSGGGGDSSGGSAGAGAHASTGSGAGAGAGAGINLGAFANLAGKTVVAANAGATTTEDTPVFDRTRVSLDVPSRAFGAGFTLITNVSKVLNSVILNSARRTQTLLEVFKPFFRGSFAIKGLPSDNQY